MKKYIFCLLFLLTMSVGAFAQTIFTVAGTDTYTVATSVVTGYKNGDRYVVKFTNANTAAATINFNSLGAKSLRKTGTTLLSAGDIAAGQVAFLVYDGTNFQLIGLGGSGSTPPSSTYVTDAIVDGVTTLAPSQNAVFDALALKNNNITTINSQTADYTPVLADGDGATEIQLSGTTGRTFTFPANASVPYPVGTYLYFRRMGTGAITFAAAGGVTLLTTKGDLTDAKQYGPMTALKTGTNTWVLNNGSTVSLISSDITGALGYTPVNPTRTIGGNALSADITNAQLITSTDGWTRVTITGDQSFTLTTLSDITSLLFPVTANVRMEFRGEFYYNANITTEGIRIVISASSPTLSSLTYRVVGTSAANSESTRFESTYAAASNITANSLTTNNMASIKGRILTTASGNVQFQAATETGAGNSVTILKGSYIEYRPVGVN